MGKDEWSSRRAEQGDLDTDGRQRRDISPSNGTTDRLKTLRDKPLEK